jgi:hypothetical protein
MNSDDERLLAADRSDACVRAGCIALAAVMPAALNLKWTPIFGQQMGLNKR